MDEYISKEAVIQYLKEYSEKELNTRGCYGMVTSSVLSKAERAISEMPAADVQPVNGWISVNDRLPEQYTDVLVFTKSGIIAVDYVMVCTTYVPSTKKPGIDTDHFTDEYEFRFYNESVTHWKPLPELPESEDEE